MPFSFVLVFQHVLIYYVMNILSLRDPIYIERETKRQWAKMKTIIQTKEYEILKKETNDKFESIRSLKSIHTQHTISNFFLESRYMYDDYIYL